MSITDAQVEAAKRGRYAPNAIDLTGQKFGRLTVIALSPERQSGQRMWQCRCDCGKQPTIRSDHLRSGRQISCGCWNIEKAGLQSGMIRSHGLTHHPLYHLWVNIKHRCNNPSYHSYHLYGGRGITIADEWANSFERFLADMGERPSPNHSIDRKDNDGPYAPWNCRWATKKEQARNMRTNALIDTPRGRMTISEAAEIAGVRHETMRGRIERGWSADRLLEAPR